MDYRRLSVFTVRGKECPEDTRNGSEISDKSGWYADYVAVVVAEVKLKGFMHTPKVMIEHFKNGPSCEAPHNSFLNGLPASR